MAKGQIKQKQANINQKLFESLCGIQCTQDEICSVLDVTDKTLTAWCKSTYGMSFSEIFKIKKGAGKVSLRRYQFELAKKNPTMAIFLGKQYLDQRDKIEAEVKRNPIEDLTPLAELLKGNK